MLFQPLFKIKIVFFQRILCYFPPPLGLAPDDPGLNLDKQMGLSKAGISIVKLSCMMQVA
jgi:hypothetical protein